MAIPLFEESLCIVQPSQLTARQTLPSSLLSRVHIIPCNFDHKYFLSPAYAITHHHHYIRCMFSSHLIRDFSHKSKSLISTNFSPYTHFFKTPQFLLIQKKNPSILRVSVQGKKMETSFEAQHPKSGPAQEKGKAATGPKFDSPQCRQLLARGPEFDSPQCFRFVSATNPNACQYNSWSAAIFDCHEDRCTCCMTAIAPCVAFGSVARFADDASALACVVKGSAYCILSLVGLQCCYSYGYREKLRMKLQLPGNRTSDFLVHCLCECCALCQEYRQVKSAKTGEAVKSVALSPPSINTMIR